MEVFDNWAQKYYKRPKKIVNKDSDTIKIDWEDFNYPSSYPLYHYNVEEINAKDTDAKSFMSVFFLFLFLYLYKYPVLLVIRFFLFKINKV